MSRAMAVSNNALNDAPASHYLVRLVWWPLRIVAALAITFHFATILVVVTHLNELLVKTDWGGPVMGVSNIYSQTTFSNRNFGFFAPGVTPDWNLHITTVDEQGVPRQFELPAPSREMQVKHYSMVGHAVENDDTMDLFARSWAVYAMNHTPEAVSVEVLITRNTIPSMAEYRDGQRIASHQIYRTTFELR